MGCNCGKKKYQTKVIMGTPEPIATPQVIQIPVEDHFNNIDKIEPINGTGIKTETGESETGTQG